MWGKCNEEISRRILFYFFFRLLCCHSIWNFLSFAPSCVDGIRNSVLFSCWCSRVECVVVVSFFLCGYFFMFCLSVVFPFFKNFFFLLLNDFFLSYLEKKEMSCILYDYTSCWLDISQVGSGKLFRWEKKKGEKICQILKDFWSCKRKVLKNCLIFDSPCNRFLLSLKKTLWENAHHHRVQHFFLLLFLTHVEWDPLFVLASNNSALHHLILQPTSSPTTVVKSFLQTLFAVSNGIQHFFLFSIQAKRKISFRKE